jgi:hypothetical protein
MGDGMGFFHSLLSRACSSLLGTSGAPKDNNSAATSNHPDKATTVASVARPKHGL